MNISKIILREFCRIVLIIASPIYFSIWVLFTYDEGWSAVTYYWESVFKKDLNSIHFKESKF